MNDRAAPERGDDRARNKRGPEGSQRTESPPRREGAVSHAKPQNEGPKKSEGRHRSKAKLDADAQGAALAFGGDEAQGPQRPDTSESAEVPGREEKDDDTFALGGRSPDGRRKSAEFEAALPRAMDTKDDALSGEVGTGSAPGRWQKQGTMLGDVLYESVGFSGSGFASSGAIAGKRCEPVDRAVSREP